MRALCPNCLEVICCCEIFARNGEPRPRTLQGWDDWCSLVQKTKPFGFIGSHEADNVATWSITNGEEGIDATVGGVECFRCHLRYKDEHTGQVKLSGTQIALCIGCLEHTQLDYEMISPPPCHVCGSREPYDDRTHPSEQPHQHFLQRTNGVETVWVHTMCMVLRANEWKRREGL